MLFRSAYIIIDESGKIDPTAAVADDGTAEGAELRFGNSPADIDLTAVFDDDTLAEKFQRVGTGNGELPAGEAWLSYYHILKANSSAAANNTAILHETVFPYSRDLEAFFDNTTTRHRFDIVNCDWENATINTLLVEATEFWDANGNIQANTGGIPWLNNCVDPDLKNQVAANIIDFYDTDEVPITDYPGESPPTYLGIERVPFLNELHFEVWFEELDTNSNGTRYAMHMRPTVELVNMWDTDKTFGPNAKIEIDFGVVVPGLGVASIASGMDLPTDTASAQAGGALYDLDPMEISLDGETVSAGSYAIFTGSDFVANPTDDDAAPDDEYVNPQGGRFRKLSVAVKGARLFDTNGNLLDYAFDEQWCPGMTGPGASGLNQGGTDFIPGAEAQVINVEANDPRHNLLSTEWTWGTWQDLTLSEDTLGQTNNACNPPQNATEADFDSDGLIDADIENGATDPWDVSTAYIRNAAPSTTTSSPLWELGAIHRGAAWQTLNLHAYYRKAVASDGMGSSLDADTHTYADGDANILDQIKLSDETVTLGRVNINTRHPKVVKGLLSRIPVNDEYDDPNASADVVSEAGATDAAGDAETAAAGEWLYVNGADPDGEQPFGGRGGIAAIGKLTNGTIFTQDTDRAQEEIIGKLANLCSVRYNYFSVLAVSQSINDHLNRGTVGTLDFAVDEANDIDRITAESARLLVIRRDAFTNEFSIVSSMVLDD